MLKPILEILAGIPSVVLGFFVPHASSRPRSSSASSATPASSTSLGRRHRRRHPHHPAGRVGVRGRHAVGARRAARGSLRDGRPQDHHRRAGRPARRGVRPGRRVHPRRLPGHRRDDGRVHRRRRRRRLAVPRRPARAGPDDDRGHGVAGRRHRPGAWARRSPSRASSSSASCCSSSPSSSTWSPTASCAGSGRPTDGAWHSTHRRRRRRRPRRRVRRQLTGGRRRRRRQRLPALLLLRRSAARARSSSSSCSSTSWPTGCGRAAPTAARLPARSRCGRRPRQAGHLPRPPGHVLDRRVRGRARLPDRHRRGRLPRGVRPPRAGSPASSTSTSATWPACRRSSTASSASRSSSKRSTGVTGGRDACIAAGITLAILVLPIVIITSAEAIRAVPAAACARRGFGVGATRWEVIRTQVLPYAAPGHPHRHRARPGPGPRRGAPLHPGRRGHRPARRRARRCSTSAQLAGAVHRPAHRHHRVDPATPSRASTRSPPPPSS